MARIMILVNTRDNASLSDFGILVPVVPKSADLVLKYLASGLQPGARPVWMIERDETVPSARDLERAHSPEYVAKLLHATERVREVERTFELINDDGSYNRYDPERAVRPLGELLDMLLDTVGGTMQCMRRALIHNFCFFLGGGMHHAMRDWGAGFCIMNDIVIGIRALQATGAIRTAWIIDTDAHKGDGTAALTADDESITTLSIHMGDSWPFTDPVVTRSGGTHPSLTPSTIDVAMHEGEDDVYLDRLRSALETLDTYPRPDLVVAVYGADPYEHDELPSTQTLRLTLDQMAARDRMVWEFVRTRDLPVAYLHSGGYGSRAWEPTSAFLSLRTARAPG